MTRKCARCGAENLPEAKFCESCGFSMDAADVAGGEPTREGRRLLQELARARCEMPYRF